MRQWNGELVEYERMKAYYKEQGKELPYKTLGAFRREVRKTKDEQSPAMQAWKRHNVDRQQYERWKQVVGAENMPKTLDKFQKMKYNDTKKYEFLKAFKEYKQQNPRSNVADYKIAEKLKEQGVRGSIHIPSQEIDVSKFSFNDEHINKERNHGVSRIEAEKYIAEAVVSVSRWEGQRVTFYSPQGISVVDTKTKSIVTSWKKDEFDENIEDMIKEVVNNGK